MRLKHEVCCSTLSLHFSHGASPHIITLSGAVCEKLRIPMTTLDFTAVYWTRVFEPFLASYAAGARISNAYSLNYEYVAWAAN